jgi:hypothetical protein
MKRAVVALALAATACGGGARSGPAASRTPASTPTPTPAAPEIAVAPNDQPLCALLFARLQRVTVALSSSSELLAQSEGKADLASRIATEQQQLERSARLMAAATVPKPLAATNRRLVAALNAFAADFRRARTPARRGDLQAVVAAMTDRAAVDRILAAAQTIERTCSP